MTTIQVTLTIEVDDNAWAEVYGAGDAYDRAEVQARRSLVADVESYVESTLGGCAAAEEGAITSVEIAQADA